MKVTMMLKKVTYQSLIIQCIYIAAAAAAAKISRVTRDSPWAQSLATELQHNVKEMRTQIRCTKKMQEDKKCGGNISKESVHRAQSLAASILNISKTDLDEILNVVNDEETEQMKMEYESDKEWLGYLQKLLEGQFPFASYLMDAVLEKINEQKKLVEEYSTLIKRAA